jgi:hypothetical protein
MQKDTDRQLCHAEAKASGESGKTGATSDEEAQVDRAAAF